MSDETTPKPTLAATIAAVAADVGVVGKDGYNQHAKYKYAGIESLARATTPIMARHGLIMVPADIATSWYDAGKTRNGATQRGCVMVVTWHVGHAHSDEVLTIVSVGEGIDSGDKAAYKSQTGARKYALLALLGIATGDDAEEYDPQAKPPEQNPEDRAAMLRERLDARIADEGWTADQVRDAIERLSAADRELLGSEYIETAIQAARDNGGQSE